MEGMGLKFTPVMRRRLLCHSSMFGPMDGTLGLIASPNNPNREFILPPVSQPPLHPPLPLPSAHLL